MTGPFPVDAAQAALGRGARTKQPPARRILSTHLPRFAMERWSITAARVMRIICATMTQVSVTTGIANARSIWPRDSMSLA